MEVEPMNDSRKMVQAESGENSGRARAVNYFVVDLSLRILLLACSVAGLVVLVTSNQSKEFPTMLPPPFPSFVSRDAKFSHSPAFIYLLVAQSVAILYSIVTILASFSQISAPSPSPKLLFLLVLFDALMVGVMAAATGSSGGVAYIGLKGNSHTGWVKICDKFSKYCRHIGSSAAISLVASIVLVMLVVLSSFSLSRRIH